MGRTLLFVIGIVVVAAAVAFVYLAFFTDIPAPSGHIEKVIPDSRLPK